MIIKALLILGLCFHTIDSYKLLRGAAIPQNYGIGLINHLEYLGDDKIYFKSAEDVMGFMNASTGALTTVFELEDDENILEHRGSRFVIIEKNRDMNLLVPSQQTYNKLKYSQYLEKQNFKKIISFNRFSQYDYILTDQFFARANHFLIMRNTAEGNQTNEKKFEILYRKQNANDVFFKLIHVIDRQPTLGIVLFNQQANKKQMCIIKITIMESKKPQKICTSIDTKLKIFDVREAGPGFQIRTQKNNLVYNEKLQFIKEIPFKDIATYYFELNKALENKNKNEANLQLKQSNQIKPILPPDHLFINVYQRYILVRKEDSVLVNIQKNPKDMPVYHWSYTRNQDSSKLDLLIQYQDGRFVCYQVDVKAKNYKQIWSFFINPVDKTVAGQLKQAKQSNLQAQQDLQQVEKGDDIQINGKDANNQL